MSISMSNILDEGMPESSSLRLCKCGRIFNPISGDCGRKDPEKWIPGWWMDSSDGQYKPPREGDPGWHPSNQPCGFCDKEYYIKRAYEHLEKYNGGHLQPPDEQGE